MSRIAAMERGMKMLQQAVAERDEKIKVMEKQIEELMKPKPLTHKKVTPKVTIDEPTV